MTEEEQAARRLTSDILKYHAADMANEAKRDAVIVKCVTLIALAFNIPPVSGKPLNIDEAANKLRTALDVLSR